MDDVIHDPYQRCDIACTHDLARAVTIAELMGEDGPHADSHLIINYTPARLRGEGGSSLAEAS